MEHEAAVPGECPVTSEARHYLRRLGDEHLSTQQQRMARQSLADTLEVVTQLATEYGLKAWSEVDARGDANVFTFRRERFGRRLQMVVSSDAKLFCAWVDRRGHQLEDVNGPNLVYDRALQIWLGAYLNDSQRPGAHRPVIAELARFLRRCFS